jgi:homopolymeric O-antigen transport system ATP-binding protein
MSSIQLNNVTIDFPIYNVSARSLKKNFLRVAIGGKVSRDSNERIIVRSLNNINLSLENGDRLGIIGHNGAGKSTLLKLLANIYEPTNGDMVITGKVSPMLGLMHGIEGEFSGYENIVQRGIIMGLSRKEIKPQVNAIIELTGLGDYIHMPVRTYSSGMMVRLAFAISTCINPEILLIDEVFGAGDAAFMDKAKQKMLDLLQQSSIVVLASHSDDLIKEFCNKALLLEGGSIKYIGDVNKTIELYRQSRD